MIAHYLDKWKGSGSCWKWGAVSFLFSRLRPPPCRSFLRRYKSRGVARLTSWPFRSFDIPKLPSQSSDDPVTCNPMVTYDNRRCQSYQLGPVHGLKPGQEHHSSEIYNSPSQLMSWNAPCVGKRDDAGARARCVGEEGKRARVPG